MNLQDKFRRFRSSFSFRLFAVFTAMTLLITFAFSIIYIRSEINAQKKRFEQRLGLLASHMSGSISLPVFAENRELLQQIILDETARHKDISAITIKNLAGNQLGEYRHPTPPSADNQMSTTVDIYSSSLSFSPETALTGGSDSSGAIVGTLQVAIDISEMSDSIRALTIKAVMVALIFWIAVSILSYAILKQVTHSFKSLMHGIETIKSGNFSVTIPVERNDEPGRAAEAVNQLALALKERDEENLRLQEELFNALRMEVQEEKKQLMARLIQTNRMTFLGLLASSMAHEINNPNGAIRLSGLYLSRAWLDAMPLLKRIAEEEGDFSLGGIPYSEARKEITRSCATIERNTELISKVVHDLRSYSLGERHEFQPDVDINQVIRNAVSTVRAYGRHGDMQVALETGEDLPLLNGSKHQLEQVIINLLLNALQAQSDNNGRVTIRSEFRPDQQQVVVTVSDQGEGIAPEDLQRLFEPFFSTKLDKGGSGLGLFVTNFIVNQHHGTLEFDSELGKGTRVTVALPSPPLP
jgi:two-component system, NtrC family, sensor kinase